MGLESKNYEAISLAAGTYTLGELGNGITGNSVHQIYCLTTGNITITAMGGGTFTWTPTAANTFIDIVPSKLVVNSGTYVAFRTKNQGISYTTNTLNG
jgi:hypothetical protein